MVLADTGYWLALANANDRFHDAAVAATRNLDDSLIVTWPVLTEACYLMLSHLGVDAEVKFVQQISNTVDIFPLSTKHLVSVAALMVKYADLPMDLADASLVVVAEELEDGRILSTDRRDFQTYRWKNTRPFTNLLLEYMDW